MRRKFFISLTAIFFLVVSNLSFFVFEPRFANAAGATLFLSPSSGSYTVGQTFNVRILVNSGGGNGINAAQFKMKFDPTMIKINSISTENSVFSLWVVGKKGYNFSNTAGTVEFGGGAPGTDAYKGTAGNACDISISVLKAGDADFSITEGMILANDGIGTNILTSFGGAKFAVKEKTETPVAPVKEPEKKPTAETTQPTEEKGVLPPSPEVTSVTHPKEDVWYSNNKPEFKWKMLADVVGVAVSYTNSSSSDPGTDSEGIVDTKSFDKVENGEWFVHVKFKNKFGWSQVSHRRFLVDTQDPENFTIKTNDQNDPTNPTPILIFNTTDAVSGIDHYKLVLDNENIEVEPTDFAVNPYHTKVLAPGEHHIQVTAFDKAGNMASSSNVFLVEPLKMPIITEMPLTLIRNRENLIIRGTSFYPQVTIQIYIAKMGKDPETFEVKTDNDGNWSFFSDKKFENGNYEIWAKLIDDRGAQSYPTTKNVLVVKSASIMQAYGILIVIILVIIVVGELLAILYLRKKFEEEKERIKREIDETKSVVGKVFNALKEEVDEQMEYADKKRGLSESERRVKERIKEAMDVAEEFIYKEIDDTEKEVSLKVKEK